jgi:hypothetical protein
MTPATRRACPAAALALVLAALPAAAQTSPAGGTPPPAAARPAEAPTSLADVARLLVTKEYIAQVHADAVLAVEKEDAARAVVELARVLAAREHLPPAGLETVAALSASPGGGASGRALAELLRELLESGKLSAQELEALQTPDGVRRLTYVPPLVRAQLRDEVKRDLLDQLQREGWATPKALPEWLRRLTFKGDIRIRYERILYRRENAVGQLPDWNAINTGSPVDVAGIDTTNDRFLNVDQDRTRPRLRARVGLDAVVSPPVTASLRLASGDGSTPVSTNQTLGGSAGNFSKYQIWLDRAALRWALVRGPGANVALEGGRFANPFFTTELVWDEDVNLDGLALETSAGAGALRPFFTAGAFPLFNTALAFPADHEQKFKSLDKWLLAAQLGSEWRPGPRMGLKLGAAYYQFRGVEARQSAPCDTNLKTATCDTDITRPSFAQNGNTYRTIRTPSDAARAAEAAGGSEYQYFGLASSFRVLAVTGRAELRLGERAGLALDGAYVRNLAFHRGLLAPDGVAWNNRKACTAAGVCPYGGGDVGYHGRVSIGSPALAKRGDWTAWLDYRYLESDATVDAFTDSDFGLGGTNLKGFAGGVALCPADGFTMGVRWYGASQIVGPPYGVDVVQLDLTGRY